MKKTLLLTLAMGVASATTVMADADLYITGSTAFRANVHDACTKLFTSYTEHTGTAATGGDSKTGNAAAQWVLTGTPITAITNVTGTLTVHGLFTGSVQGCQTVESGTKLQFLDKNGNMVLNSPTIAFSDCSSASTPYPVTATTSFAEEKVAVQPFVIVKSTAGGGLNSITNVTWEQMKYLIQIGRTPLSAWTTKPADHSSYVYLINRTKDSGTRRTTFAQVLDGYSASAGIYIYDVTNNFFYKTTSTVNGSVGASNNVFVVGVVGAAGNGNANLNWGSGYVGGGDIKTQMGISAAANQSISYLSISDAKGITGTAYSQIVPFDGVWPTAAGAGISGNTSGTNDFSPISEGTYGLWGAEVVVYPTVDPNSLPAGDQDLTLQQLGSQSTPGTLLGVLDYQTKYSNPGGPTLAGSLENEIELSKTTGATAIRLSDMQSDRASVGGTIVP